MTPGAMTERGGAASDRQARADMLLVLDSWIEQTQSGASWARGWSIWGVPVAQGDGKWMVRSRDHEGREWVSRFDERATLLGMTRVRQ